MKKTIAMLFTLVMVFSMFSVVALADEYELDMGAGDTATLTGDQVLDDNAADATEADADAAEDATELEADTEADEEVADEETEAADEETEDLADEEADEAAADEEPLLEVTEEEEAAAGVTPDSKLYGLERAMERISMALTLGKSAKAKKGLAHALERKMEIKAMMAEKKFDEAAEAQEAMDEDLAGVEEAVEELEDSDAEEELADVEEIEAQADDLQEEVDDLANEVAMKMKGRDLTEDEQAQLDEIVGKLQESTGKVSVTVDAKKNKTRVKVKIVEDRENGKGKKVTVQHTDLSKTNQGAEKKKAAAEEAGEEYAAKEKGKPEKEDGEPKAEKPAKEPKGKK